MALFIVERRDTGFTVRPGENTLQAAASALTAEAWAEGTLPGGAGTKSAKEHAEDAAASALDAENTVVQVNRAIAGAVQASAQMFDVSAAVDGFFVNHLSGTLQANADFWTSALMPVTAGLQYSQTYKSYIAWYNASGTFISGTDPTTTTRTNTAPTGAAFLRVSGRISLGHDKNLMMVSQSASVQTWVAYGGIVTGSRVTNLPGSAIADGGVTAAKIGFATQTKNLFNKATATLGYFISAEGSIVANASYGISALIPVLPSTTYTGRGTTNNTRFWAAFDASGVWMAGGSNTQGQTITTPAGCYFVRVTFFVADLNSYQFEIGSSQTSYEAYGYRFTTEMLGRTSGWSARKWAALGDSLTAQNTWTSQVTSRFGLALTNLGIGGRQVAGTDANAMWQDASVNTIPTDADVITVLGGTNDWAQNRALGTLTSTNTAEFYGALNVMIAKIIARCPTARLVLITPPYSEYAGRSGWPDASTNTAGLTIRDYAAAIRAIALRWSLPLVDWDAHSGFVSANLSSFMKADGALIHPNDAVGGPRLAPHVISVFGELEPV